MLALTLACGSAFATYASAPGIEDLSPVEDPGLYAELVAMLEREAGTRLTHHLQERGKLRQVTIGIAIEPRKHRMVVNFGPRYLPGKKDSYGELFLEPLAADLRRYSERSGMGFLDVTFSSRGSRWKSTSPMITRSQRWQHLGQRTAKPWFPRVMDTLPCTRAENGSFSGRLRSGYKRMY